MKKVLVLYYSQSGQIKSVVNSFCSDLVTSDDVEVTFQNIKPVVKYPYPWPFYTFFDAFPEAIYMDGCDVEPFESQERYDLIILSYSVWFLAPSIPITGFLKSAQAKRLFKDTPVITLIACRDMWVMAQEKMKVLLENVEAKLIDNVVLTDQGGSLYAFITTPRWLFTGLKNPFWFFPAAGVAPKEIRETSRFGKRLVSALQDDEEKENKPLLTDMGAVNVNGKLLATEKIATKSFLIWGNLIKKAGKSGSFSRKVVISIYAVFLVTLVLTIVPLNMLVRKLLYPFKKNEIEKMVKYYEKPSGK